MLTLNGRRALLEALCVEYFSFLETKFNYKRQDIISSNPLVVSWIKNNICIKIYHGPPGFEIDLTIVNKSLSNSSIYLSDIMRSQNECDKCVWSAHSETNLREGIKKFSSDLETYGYDFLIGDDIAYQGVFEAQKLLKKKELFKAKNQNHIDAANSFWENKEYSGVVRELVQVSERLPPSLRKKLMVSKNKS